MLINICSETLVANPLTPWMNTKLFMFRGAKKPQYVMRKYIKKNVTHLIRF
jgi:hypothetical protein